MKTNILFVFMVLCSSYMLNGQTRELNWFRTTFPAGYTDNDFGVCGTPNQVTFRVSYDHCPNSGYSCLRHCGNNPYRYTVRLFRDGVYLSGQTYLASSHWSNTIFSGVTASPGDYQAFVKFERRKGWFCTGWETVSTGWTNVVIGTDTPAIPDFNVDGNPLVPGRIISTCVSDIRVNAATTSCETTYLIGVQECDWQGNRTYDYEWRRWFSGTAPNNINLQNLSSTYSYPPDYIGSAGRQGNILFGGNLASGQPRYYNVMVCTNEPTFQCESTLIRVMGECFGNPADEDVNHYQVVDENWNGEFFSTDGMITVTYEAEQDEEIISDEALLETVPLENTLSAGLSIAPNPFKDVTTITINDLGAEKTVVFELYNSLGERVRVLNSSAYQFDLDRQNLATGIYFYRATVDNRLLKSGKLMIE